MRPEDILVPTPSGVCCKPGGFHIDPTRPVEYALITHGHSDHARPGHGAVLATQETLDIMRLRYGEGFAGSTQAIRYGEPIALGGTQVSFHPAGHVLGSAQIRVACGGLTIVASGDYKDVPDPTCAPFELVPCDVFITEATFGLPVFRHHDAEGEIAKLLHSVALFPERAHLVGAYSLGKAQRVIALIRAAGRRDQQHRAPMLRLGQQFELMRARRPAARLEPAAEDGGQERFCFGAFEQRYRPIQAGHLGCPAARQSRESSGLLQSAGIVPIYRRCVPKTSSSRPRPGFAASPAASTSTRCGRSSAP
jgi:hypothetical protein